jgi:uncharacterized membrane protein
LLLCLLTFFPFLILLSLFLKSVKSRFSENQDKLLTNFIRFKLTESRLFLITFTIPQVVTGTYVCISEAQLNLNQHKLHFN